MKKIRKCVKCGEFTMKLEHHKEKTVSSHPQKFSPEDKYVEYRVKEKFD